MALPGYPPILPAIKTPPANPFGAPPVGMFGLGRMQAGGPGGLVRAAVMPPMPMGQLTPLPAVMPTLPPAVAAPPMQTPQAAVTNALMQRPRFAASRGYLRY